MIELPFPPINLSPNARCHWAVKAKSFKAYKFHCFALLAQFRAQLAGRSEFAVTFHPPSARRYDIDNLVGRFKAGCDALSTACGVDDSNFVMTYRKGDCRKGGAVIIA
jgi:crossover junction endodeoxyribonuclease RusA